MIKISHLSYSYDQKEVLSDISFQMGKGNFCALMGLNGSGKSTLLKLITKLLPTQHGVIEIDRKQISDYSPTLLAQQIAYVPQKQDIIFDFSVREMVLMGRNPYQGRWERESARDLSIVERALRQCNIAHLEDRMISQLSGGEMQRTLIARAMAQEAPIMLLDEPLSNLDIIHKYEIMDILLELNQKQQTTIIIILHDFPVAIQYTDKTLILKDGALFDYGKTSEVLHPDCIKQAFGLNGKFQVDHFGHIIKREPHFS